MMCSNPFEMVYRELWHMVNDCEEFENCVRVGNRIMFVDKKNPLKEVVGYADLPEVMLTVSGGTPHMDNSSNTSKIVRIYNWVVSTGDYRLNERLFPVEWAIFIAMHKWKTHLCALEWFGEQFVKRCQLVSFSEGESDPTRNRNIVGWSTLWACEVEMWFNTNTIRST